MAKDFHVWLESRMKYSGDMDKFTDPRAGKDIQSIDQDDEYWNGHGDYGPSYSDDDPSQKGRLGTPSSDARMGRPASGENMLLQLSSLISKAEKGDQDAMAKLQQFKDEYPDAERYIRRAWRYS